MTWHTFFLNVMLFLLKLDVGMERHDTVKDHFFIQQDIRVFVYTYA